MAQLGKIFTAQSKYSGVSFINGYNPSHLAGGGDLLESITQAFANPISDHDLKTILMQIHPHVQTRKILLVGHSQGSFYVNELYDYLVSHGVPKESVAVYAVATPASYVAGGGGYVTSGNDKVINRVRGNEQGGNEQIYLNSYYAAPRAVVSSALRPNITVPKEDGWAENSNGGHALAVYLDGAARRIVGDMENELGNLKASGEESAPRDGCFEPPEADLAYKLESLALGAVDPVAEGFKTAAQDTARGALAIADGAYGAVSSLFGGALSVFGSANLQSQAGAAAAAASGEEKEVPPSPASLSAPQPQRPPVTPSSVEAPQGGSSASEAAAPQAVSPPPQQDAADPVSAPSSFFGFPQSDPSLARAAEEGAPERASVSASSSSATSTASGAGQGEEGTAQGDGQDQQSGASLAILYPAEGASLASISVSFGGTAPAGATVFASTTEGVAATSSAIAGADGAWTLALSLAEGAASVEFWATDAGGLSSATATRRVIVDLTPPAAPPAPSAPACAASLVSWDCVVATSTVRLVWEDAAGAAYYALAQEGALLAATTTATSSAAVIPFGATSTLAVVAYDAAGNAATSSPLRIAAIQRPVVINEIAWGGSGASRDAAGIQHERQWIELKNLMPYDSDLSHMAILRQDGTVIPLSGSIPYAYPSSHQNFRVVAPEGTDPVAPNQSMVSLAPLPSDAAEELRLVWIADGATTTMDATPSAAACGGAWCAGEYEKNSGSRESPSAFVNRSPRSMERRVGASDGALSSSWQSTDGYGGWIAGRGGSVWGSPGDENTYGFPEAGVFCGSPDNLLEESAPPGPAFGTGSAGCTYLSQFIAGGEGGALRDVALYRGDVGSSTPLWGHFEGVNIVREEWQDSVPQDAIPGEHFFFAMWEIRDNTDEASRFHTFFTAGTPSQAPHGTYAILPFIYQPSP